MRSSSVIKSFIWDISYYIVVILMGFLAPRFIILVYGSSVNGLSSTIIQIINVMLLLQSGATTAALYSLFKPVADNDYELISVRLNAADMFFKKISLIFMLLMLAGAVIASIYINSEIDRRMVFISFIILGFKSFLDLLFTSKYRIIFTAYQKKYLISITTLIEQLIYYALVFMTIWFRLNFVFMYVWLLLGCIVKIILLKINYIRDMGRFIPKCPQKTKDKISGRNYSLANEISHSVVSTSITIILSFTYGLEKASVYAVYDLVNQAIFVVSSSIYSSFAPSFGNLVASDNEDRKRSIFSLFQFVFMMFNTVMFICFMYLILPFIRLYTAGATDVDYVNRPLAIMIVLLGLISAYRIPYNILVSSYGLFKETWLQPVISAGISIVVSLLLGKINFALILVGPVLFYLINFIYQHFKLKQIIPIVHHLHVWKHLAISIIGITGAFLAELFYPIRRVSVGSWILSAMIVFITAVSYSVITTLLFEREYLPDLYSYISKLFRRERHIKEKI